METSSCRRSAGLPAIKNSVKLRPGTAEIHKWFALAGDDNSARSLMLRAFMTNHRSPAATGRRRQIVPTLAAILLLATPAPLHSENPAPAAAHKKRIVLVGDSTVTDGAGWGLGFK